MPSLFAASAEISVLIDTWWNVNTSEIKRSYQTAYVLIDTWWNVNIQSYSFVIDLPQVLIDTWWNVNAFKISSKCCQHAF